MSRQGTHPERDGCTAHAIDFFCGIGGMTAGMRSVGVHVCCGVDIDGQAAQTYWMNNAPAQFVQADVRRFDMRRVAPPPIGLPMLYAACAPCQPFSRLTRQSGRDARSDLLSAFAALLEARPPDAFLMENVPGLRDAPVFRRFLATAERLGFCFGDTPAVLNAADYGVPQSRRRLVLAASRHGTPRLPAAQSPRRTVRDAIGDLPEQPGATPSNHVARSLTPRNLRIVQAVPPDGGSRRDVADPSILLACHQRRPQAHTDVFGRLHWERPAPTLTTKCLNVYCGRFVHPEQPRGLTLREAARLQTFPDDYAFHGPNLTVNSAHIGNAVPPKLAAVLTRAALLA